MFDGFVGHQLEAGVTMDYAPISFRDLSQGKEFSFNTADADYSTDIGFKMRYDINPKNRLYFTNTLTNHIGLKDERSIFSFTTDYPSNLKLTPNALNSNLTFESNLPRGSIRNSLGYTGTQMGGKLGYRFDYNSIGGGNLYVSFSTPTQGISKNKVNVLPENYTLFKAGGMTPDLIKKDRVDLRINGGVEYAPTLPTPVMFQGGVKLTF